MKLLIHEIAHFTKIRVRTLHYYDEIGLFKASEISLSGYQYYIEKDIHRVKKILYCKELGFPLARIKGLLDSSISEKEMLVQQKYL